MIRVHKVVKSNQTNKYFDLSRNYFRHALSQRLFIPLLYYITNFGQLVNLENNIYIAQIMNINLFFFFVSAQFPIHLQNPAG